MPRANRYILSGQTYHVTHRCHDRSFLFRFAKDRDLYRSMIRKAVARFPITVLGYCLTSNHTHLLLKIREGGAETLGRFMQSLEGDFAQAYNLRRERSGAFWSDRYHAVMIDEGDYLWRCLRYIDLNMVRAGVVTSPADWTWCGYQEIVGLRQRYRIVDREELAEALAPGHPFEEVAPRYAAYVEAGLGGQKNVREAAWTESVAVGSEAFVRSVGAKIDGRMQMQVETTEKNLWVVKEERGADGLFSAPKNSSKVSKSPISSSQLVEALE